MRRLDFRLHRPIALADMWPCLVVLVVVVWASAEVRHWLRLRSQFQHIAVSSALRSANNERTVIEQPDDETRDRQARISKAIQALAMDPLAYLEQLSSRLPKDVALLSIESADEVGTNNFTIQVEAKDTKSVYAFWELLQTVPGTRSVVLLERKHQTGALPDIQHARFLVQRIG